MEGRESIKTKGRIKGERKEIKGEGERRENINKRKIMRRKGNRRNGRK